MSDTPPQTRNVHTTMDQLPRISQKLKLRCVRCGKKAVYDVGAILVTPPKEQKPGEPAHSYANYFRCRDCGSGGPWEVADMLRLTCLAFGAALRRETEGVYAGRCALFDGTFIETPAMGEDHLLGLIRQDPGNAFLCTRLGNLFRTCGEQARAVEWYEKAAGLDTGDLEARYHLFQFALAGDDMTKALAQALPLVRSLLEGRTTGKDDLTEGLAFSVVESLRNAPPAFRERLLAAPENSANAKEALFIRGLLAETGDEEALVNDATERLLAGEVPPPAPDEPAGVADAPTLGCSSLVPSLQSAIAVGGLDPKKLTVALLADKQGHVRLEDRHAVPVTDGEKVALWQVPSLRELCRGNKLPPADIDHYPPDYALHFFFLENHLLTLCDTKGDQTDQELEEWYSALRRRPDGRSLGPAHDFIWQVSALLLGTNALSEAEFEGILGALVRSTRRWALKPVSRNYVAFLRRTFQEGER